ncbi:MAG: O-antigen ligase family protein [Selenomonadaceae bacterium]|nr:O-antigen ligase family protein [Selenomonadaceae bacterium]
MNRVSVFARRQRIKNLEQWTIYAILVEAFFVALSPTVAAAAIMFGVITWFIRTRIDSRYKFQSLPFDVPVAIFLLVGAISVMLSSVRSFALIYNYCMLVGIYGFTYLIVGQTIRKPEQVKQVFQALGASAIIVVVCGLFQFAFGVDITDMKWTDPDAFPELRKRIFSTLENPNVLAGYLDIFICLSLGMFSSVENRFHKVLFGAAIILFAMCLVMTYSRGAFLTIVVIFVVYGIIKDWRILILFAAVIAFIAYTDTAFIERIMSSFNGNDSSEGVRVGIWVSTMAMIADHPFAGIGWGAYQYVYPQYNYYIADNDIIIYHAHNIYLNYAAEIGIVGALAFFWYFFGTMYTSLKASENPDEGKNALAQYLKNILANSSVSAYLSELMTVVNQKFVDFYDTLMKLIGKDKVKRKAKVNRRDENVVHHEEMKWSSPPLALGKKENKDDEENVTSVEKIHVAGENISVKSIKLSVDDYGEDEDTTIADDKAKLINFGKMLTIKDKILLDGLRFGIGLAFLSMALNGFTDDLLFNIQSSILMWQLGALSAAINLMKGN